MTRKSLGFLGILAVSVLTFSLAVPVWAVNYDPNPSPSKDMTMHKDKTMTSDHMKTSVNQAQRANELIGMEVTNPKGNNLGEIKEIVLNSSEDEVAYAVLRFGGFLGMGEKLFAVPWNALDIQTNPKASTHEAVTTKPETRTERVTGALKEGYTSTKERLGMGYGDHKKVAVLDVTEEQLEEAPGFDKANWPNMADPNWQKDITAYYEKNSPRYSERSKVAMGTLPKPAAGEPQFRKVTELVGLNVEGRDRNNIGEVEDIIIDTPSSKLAFAIISVPGAGEKLAALPWKALRLDPEREVAMLDADRSALDAFTFNENQYPNFGDRGYARSIYDRFKTEPYWETSPTTTPGEEQAVLPGRSPIAIPRLAAEETGTATSSEITEPGKAMSETAKPESEMTTVRGTITSVGQYHPGKGQLAGQRLRVRTDEGKMITVHTCPVNLATQKGMEFSYGQKVTITGSKAEINGKPVVLASEIRTDRNRYRTHEELGKPEGLKDSESRDVTR